MNTALKRILQTIILFLVQGLSLVILRALLPGIRISSLPAAIGLALAYSLAQSTFWYVFTVFLARLPVLLYPVFTFILSGGLVAVMGNWTPGVAIDGWATGIWITVWLTAVNAFIGGMFLVDEDASFDRNVTRRMVKRFGDVSKSNVPGFLFLEIDGLGEAELHRALEAGYMPTLRSWLERGTHRITGWETDFSSQTGSMQMGILIGNNDEIPAFRWWDRALKELVVTGDPRDAMVLERQRSSGRGLLSQGGASRGNIFSGDAEESLLTMSTVLDRKRPRGPGFYFYFISPYVLARVVSRFTLEVIKELWQSWRQSRNKDPYRISARNPLYAPLRGFMSVVMQDLATYMTIGDILRGTPAVYALYAGYDDLAHFAGMHARECYEALHETDRYLTRIERALADAPRPYHVIVLSDHGQTLGRPFDDVHGVSLEALVEALIAKKGAVYAAQKTHETWDKLSVMLTEATGEDTRTAKLVRSTLKSRRKGDLVHVGPEFESAQARAREVLVLASGCTGLLYFTQSATRVTYEEIQKHHPELLLGLAKHPGIGFVLVDSEANGNMVIGKGGIHFLRDGKVEGDDPLAAYGLNGARHLIRESRFSNCPDILVNTVYDPATQEMCGFENQASHHGGLGGPQNHAFILHPAGLVPDEEPIVTAEGLYRVLRSWRERVQGGMTGADRDLS